MYVHVCRMLQLDIESTSANLLTNNDDDDGDDDSDDEIQLFPL